MKIVVLLSFVLLLFTNCYVYQVKTYPEDEEPPKITKVLEKDKIFKLKLNDKYDKVRIAGWEGDSVKLYPKLSKEDGVFKVHKEDIQEVRHRIFKKWYSNGLSLLGYGAAATLIILLL